MVDDALMGDQVAASIIDTQRLFQYSPNIHSPSPGYSAACQSKADRPASGRDPVCGATEDGKPGWLRRNSALIPRPALRKHLSAGLQGASFPKQSNRNVGAFFEGRARDG